MPNDTLRIVAEALHRLGGDDLPKKGCKKCNTLAQAAISAMMQSQEMREVREALANATSNNPVGYMVACRNAIANLDKLMDKA